MAAPAKKTAFNWSVNKLLGCEWLKRASRQSFFMAPSIFGAAVAAAAFEVVVYTLQNSLCM